MNYKMTSDTLKLVYKKNLTQDLAIFRFSPSDDSDVLDFSPGQFVELGMKLDKDKITFRDYSISSPPYEKKYYEFYIKHKEHPELGKFTTPLFKLKIDDVVFWKKPRGMFTIEEKRSNGEAESRQMILVASGTGLAPFMSYILHLRKVGSKRKIILIHGASYSSELGYIDMLEKMTTEKNELWNFTYIPTVSRPDDPLSKGWKGNRGRVENVLSGIEKHESKLEKIIDGKVLPDNSMFYLCGYKSMIDYVSDMLSPVGFVSNKHKRKDGSFDIKYELYGV